MATLIFKIKQALKSKTFWLIVATFIINSIAPIRSLIPTEFLPFVDLALAMLTTATHIYPSQDYTQTVAKDPQV